MPFVAFIAVAVIVVTAGSTAVTVFGVIITTTVIVMVIVGVAIIVTFITVMSIIDWCSNGSWDMSGRCTGCVHKLNQLIVQAVQFV